jgi:hypothetical protein
VIHIFRKDDDLLAKTPHDVPPMLFDAFTVFTFMSCFAGPHPAVAVSRAGGLGLISALMEEKLLDQQVEEDKSLIPKQPAVPSGRGGTLPVRVSHYYLRLTGKSAGSSWTYTVPTSCDLAGEAVGGVRDVERCDSNNEGLDGNADLNPGFLGVGSAAACKRGTTRRAGDARLELRWS